MKPWLAALWILTLAAAFGLARWTGPGRDSAPPGVDSFRSGLQESDPIERAYRISAFLRELGPDGFSTAVETFAASQAQLTEQEMRLFMLVWTRHDAPAAFAWARAWPKTAWRQSLTAAALSGWATQDGGAALAAYEAIENLNDDSMLSLRQAVLEGWMRSGDKQGVSDYVARVSEAPRRGRLIFLLAGTIAQESDEALIQWVEALPEDAPNDFKQGAFYHASSALARSEPGRATAWLESHMEQPYSVGAMEGIALKWAQHHDAAELFGWLLSLPPLGEREFERADAIASGFRIWQRQAPGEAEAWLRSALPDPRLDPAIGELVRAQANSSPSSAMEWSQRIHDETLRLERTRIAGRAWRREDPEALELWLAKSDVPEDLQQSLLRSGSLAARRRTAAAARNRGEPPAREPPAREPR